MTAIQHLNAGLMFCASALALLSAQAAHAESWLAFAKTGNPANPKVGAWPAYTPAQRNMMVFRATPGVEVDIRAEERAATAA